MPTNAESTHLSTVAWSFVDEAVPSTVVVTTGGLLYDWTDGVLDHALGFGTFNPATGLYTIGRSGIYQVDVDADIDPSDDTGVQTMGIRLNGGLAFHERLQRSHPAALAGRKTLVIHGLTLALTAGTTVALAFTSDQSADTQSIYAASVMLQIVQAQLGTAI